ncbi:MAG: hypothetical protein OEM62_03290 [Acidobacteriota bacterium]|nr:hypothetical protein [Acidobacteriota bacterium]
MRVSFSESFRLPISDVFSYFPTPADWTRLYGLMGEVKELGDGWYSVPLKSFPFPLVARITAVEPNQRVRWVFRGFWRGEGEVRFEDVDGVVAVSGYEDISVRWLGPLSVLAEKLFLERTFRSIWALGWRRLRRVEAPIGEVETIKGGGIGAAEPESRMSERAQ